MQYVSKIGLYQQLKTTNAVYYFIVHKNKCHLKIAAKSSALLEDVSE